MPRLGRRWEHRRCCWRRRWRQPQRHLRGRRCRGSRQLLQQVSRACRNLWAAAGPADGPLCKPILTEGCVLCARDTSTTGPLCLCRPPPPFQACIPRPMLLLLLLLPGAWGPRVSSINFCSCRRRVRRSSSLPAPRAFYPRCRRLWLGRLPRCQVLRCRTNWLAKRCQKPLQHISVATMTAPCSSAKR